MADAEVTEETKLGRSYAFLVLHSADGVRFDLMLPSTPDAEEAGEYVKKALIKLIESGEVVL